MVLPGVTISRQLVDIEFTHTQFMCQPDQSMHEHYRSVLISLCNRIVTCEEFLKMIKQDAIYMEQMQTIRNKIAEIEKDVSK